VKIGNLVHVHVLSAQQIFGLIVVGNLPELFSQVELLLATLQLTRANTQSENALARLLELRAGGASLQTLPHQATAWSKEASSGCDRSRAGGGDSSCCWTSLP
jgi:hypothetical protein